MVAAQLSGVRALQYIDASKPELAGGIAAGAGADPQPRQDFVSIWQHQAFSHTRPRASTSSRQAPAISNQNTTGSSLWSSRRPIAIAPAIAVATTTERAALRLGRIDCALHASDAGFMNH